MTAPKSWCSCGGPWPCRRRRWWNLFRHEELLDVSALVRRDLEAMLQGLKSAELVGGRVTRLQYDSGEHPARPASWRWDRVGSVLLVAAVVALVVYELGHGRPLDALFALTFVPPCAMLWRSAWGA